jgi:hypothetical protein
LRAIRLLLLASVTFGLLGLPATTANASFHLMNVVEVFIGPADAPDARYVELQMYSAGQTQLQGAEVRFFGPDGTPTGTATFASGVPVGTNRSSILVATEEAAALFGVTADLTMQPDLIGEGGKVCFGGTIDCVSWSSSAAANSFTAGDTGIPGGAAIVRDTSGGTDPAGLDSGDDTNDSSMDFALGVPSPRNNAGVVGATPGGTLSFDAPGYAVTEGAPVSIGITRSGGAGEVCVDLTSSNGTATSPADHSDLDQQVCFAEGEPTKTVELATVDDGVEETDETVILRLRNPTGGSVLGAANATATIAGELEGSLVSTIETPEHGATYRQSGLAAFSGTAGSVDSVQIALLAKMTSGTCKWFDFGDLSFSKGKCSRKRFSRVPAPEGPVDAWGFPRHFSLRKSKGTKWKHYTLYSRAVIGTQRETTFDTGRNANRFEMR